jgi:hypothetical protein
MKKGFLLLSIIGWFGIGMGMLDAQELSVVARVNQKSITLQDRLEYEIVISGQDINNVPNPKLPDFSGYFDIVSTSESTAFSWINGKVSSSKTKRYILVPCKTGMFVIKPAQFSFQGKTYKTNSLTVEIKEAEKAAITQKQTKALSNNQQKVSTPSNEASFNDLVNSNIFVHSFVDKQEVFVGEQIKYTANFYKRIRLWSNINFEAPSFKGFWVEALQEREQYYLQDIGKRRYYVFEIIKKALFALEPGELIIDEAKVGCVVNPFDGQRVLKSKPIKIKVKPLPQIGKPQNFSGAVGDFTLHLEEKDFNLKQDTPKAIKVVLKGKGNLGTISDLVFAKIPEVKIYKSKVEDKITNLEEVQGEKVFEYILIPKVAHSMVLAPFSFSYFSIKDKKYKTIKTAEINLNVMPMDKSEQRRHSKQTIRKEEIEVLSKDISYLKIPVKIKEKYVYLWEKAWGIILLVINALVFLGILILFLLKKIIKRDIKEEKKSKAYDIAMRQLNLLLKEAHKDKKAISKTQNIFFEYLSNKTGLPFLGLTNKEIEEQLTERAVDAVIVKQILELIDDISFTMYSSLEEPVKNRILLIEKTILIVKQLRKWRPKEV